MFTANPALVQPRWFEAIPALYGLAACIYVMIMLVLIYVNVLFVYISVYNVSVYVEMFIPYHMYVCMYVNIFTDIRIHCRAGPAVSCISHLLLQ